MYSPSGRTVGRWRDLVTVSMMQLIVFLRTVDYLRTEFEYAKDEVKLYAQDPMFTSEDRNFFGSLGVQIVDGPQGDLLVDAKTFAYGPLVPSPLTVNPWTRCEQHRPSLHICHTFDNMLWCIDENFDSPRLTKDRRMELRAQVLAYGESIVAFPLAHPTSKFEEAATHETVIHVRKMVVPESEAVRRCTISCTKVANTWTEESYGPEVDADVYPRVAGIITRADWLRYRGRPVG